jgi:small-conductance mechanosensitive channel
MEISNTQFLDNSLQSWITALIIVVIVTVILVLAKRLILSRLKVDELAPIHISHLVFRLANRTHFLFLLVVALNIGTMQLSLPDNLSSGLQTTSLIIFFVQVGFWGIAVINYYVSRYVQQRAEDDAGGATTVSALGMVTKGVLWVLVSLLILENLGVEVVTLIAGLGISGIAVALAVQNILGDLFASFSIVMDQPIVIGDRITIDEHIGTVEHIGLKSTRIRSINGEELVFSNSDLLNSRIRNFKRMERRRTLFLIGVTYQTPTNKIKKIPGLIQEIIEAQELATFDRSHFKGYGDFSLNFEIAYYVESPDYKTYMDVQQAVNLAIFERFHQEEIEFAYPTQTLFLQKES